MSLPLTPPKTLPDHPHQPPQKTCDQRNRLRQPQVRANFDAAWLP
ncbi:MAG: hypothetical protein RI897_313 [Verrucomicrobiota bacterium]|jgi:hypothetical protein